jgi:hypothetical protein
VGLDGLRAAIDLGAQVLGVAVQTMKLSQDGCRSRHEVLLSNHYKDTKDTKN